MLQALKAFWKADRYRRWLLVGGFVYAWLMTQGIPLWDDDFTSWFWKIQDRSIFALVWEWLSPVSTQPQHWGFNERPLQSILYRLCYLISGYEAWSYFALKSAVYAGLGVMIYQWGLRLVPATEDGRRAAMLAAAFFGLAPGPLAALILHQDLAPYAELILLGLTYAIWDAVERTPASWLGWPAWKSSEQQRAWARRWALLVVLTYLGYKSKADVKLVPVILALYVALVRRRQWRLFLAPVAAMCLLAVPWGPGILSRLPPFLPGSGGSEIGWMWQPARFGRFLDFLWDRGDLGGWAGFVRSLSAPPISLAGLLGPFLLVGAAVFFLWQLERKGVENVPWRRLSAPVDRARAFALCWLAVILAGSAALPAINPTFAVRYGILTMVPASLLLAWTMGFFAAAARPRPAVLYAGLALLAVQAGVNLNRSIQYRRDMGQVMVAVDQVYEKVARTAPPGTKLALLPDFRPYDYRPDAPQLFREKEWLGSADDLVKRHTPQRTYVISWSPSLWEGLELVEHATGCRSTSLFDRLFPCPAGAGAYLMRFVGQDPLYADGEKLRAAGDVAGARRLHSQYVSKYPLSMAGHFVLGLEAFEQRDWAQAEASYSLLERYFPNHLAILYNRALALEELKFYDEAVVRLQRIVDREPSNYAALIHLYSTHEKAGRPGRAREVLAAMKRLFPNDASVDRLLSAAK